MAVPATIRKKDSKLIEALNSIMGSPPEGDDIAFLHTTFCQVGLPRSKPKGQVFERRSGNVALRLEAGTLWDGQQYVPQPLPYGTKPRLLLLHIIRAHLRTGDRTITLGDSITDFLQNTLNINASGGRNGGLTGFKQQIRSFAASRMVIGYNMPSGSVRTRPAERIVEEFEAWPETHQRTGQRTLWPSSITISSDFARSIQQASVPLDARAIRAIQNSALALDLYAWLAHRLHRLDKPIILNWAPLREQFGTEIDDSRNFKRNFKSAMRDVLAVYPDARVNEVFGGIQLIPSRPPVRRTKIIVSDRT